MLPLLTILSVSRDKASLTCGAAIGRAGNFQFSEQIARFLRKNEQMSDLLKNEQFTCHSFLVSDLSDSLTSLIFGE